MEISFDVYWLGIMVIAAMLFTLITMPVAIKLSYWTHAIDKPDNRKVHAAPTPLLGGLAISVSFFVSSYLFVPQDVYLDAFLAGLGIVTLTGLADDIWNIRPIFKFLGQIIAALAFIQIGDNAINSFGDLLGMGPIETGLAAVPITVFCMVGVMNAINLSDGLDGLAAGMSIIACVFLAYFAIDTGYWLCLVLATTLFGSLLGFLYFNTHPAKVFMGDSGSLVLGYALAAICILFQKAVDRHDVAPISLALILALPILDTFQVMAVRLLSGDKLFLPDNRHLHHRLLSLKISHGSAVILMYLAMLSFGLAAVFMRSMPEWLQFTVGWALGAGIFGIVFILQALHFDADKRWHLNLSILHESRVYIFITKAMGKTVAICGWLLPVALVFPALFLPDLDDTLNRIVLVVLASLIILFPWRSYADRRGWVNGLTYLGIYFLFLTYNLSGSAGHVYYLMMLTYITALWLIFKLFFNRRDEGVLQISAIEVLAIAITWLSSFILIEFVSFTHPLQNILIVTCLEAVPFFVVIKIIAHRDSRRYITVFCSLAAAYSLIGVESVIGVSVAAEIIRLLQGVR